MDIWLFLTFLFACGASAATGAMFEPGDWYKGLAKPRWTPPGFVFPLVWSILYLLISWAAMRVAMQPGSGQALALFAVQLAFNVLWTPVFFGLRRMRAAMIVMGFLWVGVAATCIAFWQVDPQAGLAMLPYLVWVSIAGALNLSVLRRNPAFAN